MPYFLLQTATVYGYGISSNKPTLDYDAEVVLALAQKEFILQLIHFRTFSPCHFDVWVWICPLGHGQRPSELCIPAG